MGRLTEQLNTGKGGRLAASLPPPPPAPEQKSLGGFGNNLMRSGGDFIAGIINAGINTFIPGEQNTLLNLGRLGAGAVQKLIPGEQEQEKYADAVGGYFGDRYGSGKATKETLYKDPIGALGDLSTVLGGGATALKGASLASKAGAASKLSKAANVASKASQFTDPLRAPSTITKAALLSPKVSGALASSARRTMQSALKPSDAVINRHPRTDIVGTALKEKAIVSPRGLDVIDSDISEINKAVDAKVADAAARGVTLDPERVLAELQRERGVYANQVNPQRDLDTFDRAREGFLNHPDVRPVAPAGVFSEVKGDIPEPTVFMRTTDLRATKPGVVDLRPKGKSGVVPLDRPGFKPSTPKPTVDLYPKGKSAVDLREVSPPPPLRQIPVDRGQELKKGTYKKLGDRAFKLNPNTLPADMDSQKALARGLKNEIAANVDGVDELNARESGLIGVQDALEDAVRRTQNRDLLSLKTLIALVNDPRGVGLTILDQPGLKSRAANALYGASQGDLPSLPSLPGSSNPILNALYNVISPTRFATQKSVLTKPARQ